MGKDNDATRCHSAHIVLPWKRDHQRNNEKERISKVARSNRLKYQKGNIKNPSKLLGEKILKLITKELHIKKK